MSADKPISVGSLLALQRWNKATAEDRAEAARKMVAGRVRKAAKRKKGSKR